MVFGTTVQVNGSLHEVNIPAKTADVLEWLRTKLKQSGLQYQGKIKEKDGWVAVFAESGSDSDDNINQHVLGGNFQEEIFVGTIAMMFTKSSNEDNYDKPASVYTNLKHTEYESMYSNWTFDDDDEEEEVDGDIIDNDGDEEEEVVDEELIDDDAESEKSEEEAPVTKKTRVKAPVVIQDINTDTPLRQLVRQRFTEIGLSDFVNDIEQSILQRSIRECADMCIDVSWNSPIFVNHYRGRCIHLFENLVGNDSYVKNPTIWKDKLLSGDVTAVQLAEMAPMDLHGGRWKAQVEAQIEKDKHLYSNKGGASIYLYCSVCKKKSKCDYYQMQTRSADEPMTTFVTCLECDKRWKF
jgi:hypothetical protein